MIKLRVTQTVLQQAVAGEEDQPLAILIQPSHGVDIRDRNEAFQRGLGAFTGFGELRQDAVGFVEEDMTVHAGQGQILRRWSKE